MSKTNKIINEIIESEFEAKIEALTEKIEEQERQREALLDHIVGTNRQQKNMPNGDKLDE